MFPARKPLAEDFERTEVTIDGVTKPVWRSGNGPGVVIMHEVPGITPRVASSRPAQELLLTMTMLRGSQALTS